MSVYPPPLSQTPIFNPAFFTETVTSVIGGASPPDPTTYLEFPDAQGPETFTNNGGNNTLVVGASELSIGYDVLTVPKGIAMNGQGFAYNNGAVVSTTTWSGLQTKIEAIQAIAPASDSTTLNVNDAITIQNGESPTATNTIIISTSAGDNQLLLNDDAGTEGYVLTSGGADGSITWAVGGGSTPSLADVLDVSSVATADQTITLSRGVDEAHPYGTQTILNDTNGSITTSYQLTGIQGEHFTSGSLLPDKLYMTDENNTTIDVVNTNTGQLTPSSLALQSRVGSVSAPEITQVSISPTFISLASQPYTATSSGIEIYQSKKIGLITNNTTDYGTAGQVLTSGGSGGELTWTDVVVSTPSLADVLDVSSVATADQTITLSTSTDTNVVSGTGVAISTATQTTTFSATGMGTDSTTQPLNINAPFTLVSPVIDTPDLPLCYTPYAGYGDALIVYNNVGVVPEVSAGYAEVIFQNISATSQSSNITAICESDGDYMTMGQVSQTGTALYNTFFEIQGAGYMSSTGHQILGANSAGSADKSVVIAYGNGTAGFQVSPSGAIAFDATPLVADGVVSLQNGDFGDAGQYLVSQGDTLPPVWTSPSTPSLADVLDVSPAGVANLEQSISIPAVNFNQYIGVNATYGGGGFGVSANETTTPDEITDYVGFTIEGFNAFRNDLISDPITQVSTEITPTYTTIKDITGDASTTATQLINILSASSITIQNDSIVSSTQTTNSSAELTNSTLTFTTLSSETESVIQSSGCRFEKVEDDINVATADMNLSSGGNITLTYLDPETIGTSILINSSTDSISMLHKESGTHDTLTLESSQILLDNLIDNTSLTLTSSSIDFSGMANYTGDAITSTASSFSIQNPTLINIGTSGDVPPKTIAIGHQGVSLDDYAILNLNGKLNFNNLLFSGGIGFTVQQSVATYTIPADADRNTFFNLYISGTASPTPVIFPTDDVGGKYITIYNGGSNSLLLSCPATPIRPFIGGVIGVAGATTYPVRPNQSVSFVSGGSQGFINLYATNPNSNQVSNPYPVQTATQNQRIFSVRITGGSVNGTYTYSTAFTSAPSVQLTAEDATGNHTMTLRTNTTTGFTYVSSSGSFPTALHIYALGV